MEHARPPAELIIESGPVARADAWKRWRQQFILFLKASGAYTEPKSVQSSLLANLIGPEGFDIYQTFTFDDENERDDIQVLLKKFDAHFGAKVNVTLTRYKFFTRKQEEGESIQQYVTALRLLSKNCEFLSLEEELIKDRIVCGVRNSAIRDRLLRCDDLNLDKAIKLCQADEVSQESGSQLAGDNSVSSAVHVNTVVERSGRNARGYGRRGGYAAARAPTMATSRSRAAGRGQSFPGHRIRQGAGSAMAVCDACGSVRCIQGHCAAQQVICYACGNRGHFARMCKMNQSNYFKEKRVYDVEHEINDSDSSDKSDCFYISTVNCQLNNNSDEWYEILSCDNGREKFKLDTGADVNVISFEKFLRLGFNKNIINSNNIRLKSYSGNSIPIKGFCDLMWYFKDNCFKLNFAVADMRCQSLLGRKSCEQLGLVKRVHCIKITDYDDLFKGLGCLPGKHHIVVDKSVQPVICALRKIPLSLTDRLAKELKKMEELKVIRKVSHPTQWVHPLVLVAKKNNGLRICLDPRELNRAVQRAHFQLPTLTEMAAKLSGARFFSVLDANSGFWTIRLDEESADLCTFATPFGRYQFLRLPFGINSAPEVFHGKIRQYLEDLDGVDSFIDDIIVWGSTKQEHDLRLKALLDRARNINLKFNKEKCKLGVREVSYLGHIFDENGMRPDYNKIKAIKEMPTPKNRKDLERFLGAVNYLSKFIPNYSQHAIPLTGLLKKDYSWQWEESEQAAFDKLKQCVCSAPVLALYDVKQPVTLSVDASRDALGAVILQNNRPVEYASRTLTDAQKRYAQIEKELLAIVFACERFHQYIFGKQAVIVESDHKPLESIFKKPLMSVPARLQRMLFKIQCYDLAVRYVPGKYMYIPDTLSRAPLPDLYNEEISKNILYQIQMVVSSMPISNDKLSLIKKHTAIDSELKFLLNYIKTGWPDCKSNVTHEVKEYWSIKDELFVIDDTIFRQNLVVIPKSLRLNMLHIIHEGHLGIDRCKRRARQVLYWPNMSRDIETFVKKCPTCQECSNNPAKEPMIPSHIPIIPWERVGSDIFEFRKQYFLIIVDFYSNYIEVGKLNNLTSNTVIQTMKEIFSRHGIPKTVVSDNGTQYSSREFKSFSEQWGFDHVTSSPNYPQSNGKSERAVQTIKNLLKKSFMNNSDFYIALLNFRNTPRDGLSSPSQLLMGRRLRCKLPVHPDLLKPKPINPIEYKKMLKNQHVSKKYYDRNCKPLRPLSLNDPVICINGKNKTRGTVIGMANTPRSYIIRNKLGATYRRNRRHLIKCHTENLPSSLEVKSGDIATGEMSQQRDQLMSDSNYDKKINPTMPRAKRCTAPPQRPSPPVTRSKVKKIILKAINNT